MTPFGRYKFLCVPSGICSISEHHNRRMDEALCGLGNYQKVVDHIVIYDLGSHVHLIKVSSQMCRKRHPSAQGQV